MLHIKRFEPVFSADREFVGLQKRRDSAALTFNLNADRHCTSDVLYPPPLEHALDDAAVQLDAGGEFNEYTLRSFVVHLGERAGGGHYKCAVGQSAGQWVEYDDEYVTEVSRSKLAEDGKQNAYLLFYQFGSLFAK